MDECAGTFSVRQDDVDAGGSLAVPTLAAFLEALAVRHADELGCGLDALRERGLTWVLVRQRIDVAARIVPGDALVVTTWPSGIDRLLVSREFVAVRGGGEEVARASTQWALLDLATRRPVRPAEALDPALRPGRTRLLALEPTLPAPGRAAAERAFDVDERDIDVNRHVNHRSYMAWALASIPAAGGAAPIRVASVEAHHLAEALPGDAVVARTDREPSGAFLHAVVRPRDGRELARLRTRWAPG